MWRKDPDQNVKQSSHVCENNSRVLNCVWTSPNTITSGSFTYLILTHLKMALKSFRVIILLIMERKTLDPMESAFYNTAVSTMEGLFTRNVCLRTFVNVQV